MPNAPTWESGVHTHGDGIMHIHPFQQSEEGSGARMVKWFEYGGGELSQDSIRLPGESEENTVHNGDVCPEGTPEAGETGVLQVFVNGAKMENWSRFIPHDGDQIKIVFGQADSIVQREDRQIIDEEPDETIEIDMTGDVTSVQFSPSAPTVKAGDAVQLLIHNKTALSLQFRVLGVDKESGTPDDFVAVPVGSDPKTQDQGDVILPNTDGFVIVRFDDAGQIPFEAPGSDNKATGTIIVEGTSESATPTPGPILNADVTASMVMNDEAYDPVDLTIPGSAGKTFGVTLTNNGRFVHNIRIAGPDNEFNTEDDIVSDDVPPLSQATTPTPTATPAASEGATDTSSATPAATPAPVNTGSVLGRIDEPGTYQYRDDYHSDITGTIVIE
jgi:plastocyanin